MRSKSYLFLLLVLGLAVIAGFLNVQKEPKYGLDVQGGVRLTYQIVPPRGKNLTTTDRKELQSRLVTVLQNRASSSLGVVEANVQPKGDDQVIVELPGYTNTDKAKEVIGTSARIEFYDAKTLGNKFNTFSRYSAAGDSKDSASPLVSFEDNITHKQITYDKDREAYQGIIHSWDLILSGDELKSAEPESRSSSYEPLMHFSPTGAEKMSRWSHKYADSQEKLAAVLDGRVLSVAPIADGAILSDNAVIQGTFSPEYVKNLVTLLNAGSLPADLVLLSSNQESPTIGQNAVRQMEVAGTIAFGVISIFLLGYYAFPGVVAVLALGLYVLFTLTTLKVIGATFSLAGIAGFILSVGMAVDANILVFERFKEEMKHGRTLQQAIELGFRRALPAIIDSNACTVLTSVVLVNVGTGPVKGFATTLIFGVIISLFTAVTVTRSLLMFFVGSGIATNPKWYAVQRNWFGRKFDLDKGMEPLQIVNNSKKWFFISAATILVCIPAFFAGGFKPNVEFLGGYELQYATSNTAITSTQIESSLSGHGYKGANVKFGTGAQNQRIVYITVPASANVRLNDSTLSDKVASAAGLSPAVSAGVTEIGPTVQKETEMSAVIGVLGSSTLIVLYLAIRFGLGFGGFVPGLRFGFSAIGALIHDILVVFGTAAVVGLLLKWEVSGLFLTAMLTIIGFSVHDTIVIFDRIRENLRRPLKGEEFGHLVNRSITQSFARSINTSMTVIVTLMILVIAGTPTPDLKFFVVAMLIGILSGTYSSIYNASPILYLWDKAVGKAKGEDHTLVGMANIELARSRMLQTNLSHHTPAEVPTQAPMPGQGGRTYGQVRRRANAVAKSQIELNDDDQP